MGPRNRFQGMNSASICSLAGGIHSLESISGLHKRLTILAQFRGFLHRFAFTVFSYPFLDRFFHLQHADFNGEHLSYLNRKKLATVLVYGLTNQFPFESGIAGQKCTVQPPFFPRVSACLPQGPTHSGI
jgi:hypothetical protein